MRALLIVLDGLGVGCSSACADFDHGADTLGHVLAAAPDIELPTLFSLGLGEIQKGRVFDPPARRCDASYGRMRPRAMGCDSASSHWELAGAVADAPFASFEQLPDALIAAVETDAHVEFVGHCSRSATLSDEELMAEHLRTGKPILISLPDSTMRIAAAEAVVSAARLHEICRVARRHGDDWKIRRVIARAYSAATGDPGTVPYREHQYTIAPPRTVLNAISEMGLPVTGIGKVGDIFARSGLSFSPPTTSNEETLRAIEQIWASPENGMIFANLADFDLRFGHGRDPVGFARALEQFDRWLERFFKEIESDDLLIIAGDHGNDPTFPGSGHTREEIPVMVHYDGRSGPLGIRNTLADVAATLTRFFNLAQPWPVGTPLITFHRASQE